MRRLERIVAPGEHEAGERSWEVVRAAYEAREPVAWPRRHGRPLAVGALAAAVVAAAISPPGRSVIHSLRKAVGVQRAQPELFSLPTSGRLLVSGPGGAWIVNADGSRRRLGPYREAAWSPHGLFVVATRPNELVALDPKGKIRWALPRRSPRFPAWTGTRADTRVAYVSGGRLRVVAGDGTGDRAVGRAAPVAPAWRPGPARVLAYVKGRSAVVYDLDRGSVLLRAKPSETPRKLEWSDDGRLLLVFSPHATRVYDARGRVVAQDDPSDATADADASFVPGTHRVAAIRVHGTQSDVFLFRTGRLLFTGTGVLGRLAWAPNGRWLLVTWPTANQWVFVRAKPRRIIGASRISGQFGGFPTTTSWCCGR